MAKTLEYYVRFMGIPKKLAMNFIQQVDFRLTLPGGAGRYLPSTDITVGLPFANMKLVLKNLPHIFDHEYVTVMIEERIAL